MVFIKNLVNFFSRSDGQKKRKKVIGTRCDYQTGEGRQYFIR